ncbi:hypothetical protein JB92DRAFT_3116906 [Gautieria morchelliformis]|nr:hypothetical protein JB92DRAFT_3116906 [Gautieria morchelliformis]
MDDEEAYRKLITPYTFYHLLFVSKLEDAVNEEHNSGEENGAAQQLHHHVQVYPDEGKASIHHIFMEVAESMPNMQSIVARAKGYTGALRKVRKVGSGARAQAIWLGLLRLVIIYILESGLDNKFILETAEQLQEVLEDNKTNTEAVILIQGTHYRVCAPKTGKMQSAIFWTKESEADITPTWEKVFGGVIYNADTLQEIFKDEGTLSQQMVEATMLSVIDNITVQRGQRMSTDGMMVKGMGLQSTNGKLYTGQIKPLPEPTSANPRPATLQKIHERQQLREELHKNWGFNQAIWYNLILGFLPPWAKHQQALSEMYPDQLLNELGTPNTSSFCTYAYCASSHLDKDDGYTWGRVVRRSNKVLRSESNFIWASHKLTVEMEEGAFWFWNASQDYHGTSMNRIALLRPATFKNFVKHAPDDAQWTLVHVVPYSVTMAARAESRA